MLVILVLGITALQLVPPILTITLIDRVFPEGNLNLLMQTIFILVATYVTINVLSAIRIRLSGWLGQHIIFDLRTAIYDHLQRLSLSYFEKRPTGAIMARVTSDTNQLQHFIVQVLPQTVVNITTLVGIGIVLFTMNLRLAFLALAASPHRGPTDPGLHPPIEKRLPTCMAAVQRSERPFGGYHPGNSGGQGLHYRGERIGKVCGAER